MIDAREVRDFLVKTNLNNPNSHFTEMFDSAAWYVGLRIPMPVKVEGDSWKCPGCGLTYENCDHDNFCRRCGQAWAWEE